MKESRKQFIRKAYEAACSDWKEKIKAEFPKLFRAEEFKIGHWAFHPIGFDEYKVFRVGEITRAHGTAYLHPCDKTTSDLDAIWNREVEGCRKATPEEIEEHLMGEAKKRGFKEGVHYRNRLRSSGVIKESCWQYREQHDALCQVNNFSEQNAHFIYDEGQWAEPLNETPCDVLGIIEKYGKEELKKWL